MKAQLPHYLHSRLETVAPCRVNYLLVNRPEITQEALIMKRYSFVIGIIVAAVTCSNLFAQDKAALQPKADPAIHIKRAEIDAAGFNG